MTDLITTNSAPDPFDPAALRLATLFTTINRQGVLSLWTVKYRASDVRKYINERIVQSTAAYSDGRPQRRRAAVALEGAPR